ncbi:hypothetical protein jhhlp_003559 [Lomentospora prolificans]|uniref:AAA+ ATPase domain-containing protein n=1 Tax=Lomentospora prolificans TaxID=41688 RepID=A0A2N3N928_9PEZI|nr:hypothetical protein jhhlp_003559 [Lomentospora prolificans]
MSFECRIRPFNPPSKTGKPEERPDLRRPPILYVNRATFEALERAYGTPGAVVHVRVERLQDGEVMGEGGAAQGGDGAQTTAVPLARQATVMPSAQEMKADVVKMTRVFMEAVGFHTGDLVRITANRTVAGDKVAEKVVVEDITKQESNGPILFALKGWERTLWEFGIREFFAKRATYVYPGAVFELKLVTTSRQFKVLSVNSRTDNLGRIDQSTTVELAHAGLTMGSTSQDATISRELVVSGVPGLGPQMTALNEFFADLQSSIPALSSLDARWRSCAVAIHGGRGTGKTFVLDRIAKACEGKLKVVRAGKASPPSAMSGILVQAEMDQPCVVLLDDLDEILETGQRAVPQLVGILAAGLDKFAGDAAESGKAPVIVVATCKDYFTLPHELRRLKRFVKAIALPIPDVSSKVEILKSFNIPMPQEHKEETLLDVAKRTYAFNPEDLERLASAAVDAAVRRLRRDIKAGVKDAESPLSCTRQDLESALARTTPSSLHDINLRPPTVHWKDIGGQQKVKNELQRMIREVLGQSPLCLQPPKGILMYGPPGCAKTYCAQALATESGFNFFSVKGPELLNQYVGETERNIRRLFQRAAASAPAIIFFDELDTMGLTPRRGGSKGGGSAQGGVGVGILGALLTELDGFEKLEDVVVLAATNSPESIEPALLRSGRLDRYLFVGPPDAKEREEIFAIYAAKVPMAADVDLAELAALTEGYTGADIRGLVNEAGHIVFMERGGETEGAEIGLEHLQKAIGLRGPSVTEPILRRYTEWRPSHNFKS